MILRFISITLLFMLAMGGCLKQAEKRVRADDFDSFWLWAGVKPQPVLTDAKSLYILAGEITTEHPVRFTSRLAGPPRLKVGQLWLVVRVETLDWPSEVVDEILARMEAWRTAGNQVTGLQIDFDARTRHLGDYAAFLARLRQRLPQQSKLSITGLLDWSANGDPNSLKKLTGTVDEIVIQTYQARMTIPGYQAYFRKLRDFPLPFQVGLVQGGEWAEPIGLATNPRFQGYTIFLVNPSGRDARH